MGKKTDYETLKKTWYKKLKKVGFNDIEYADGSAESAIPPLLRSDRRQENTYEMVRDYYAMAYHFLNAYQFEKPIYRVIWEYHTEGLSIREIAKILKKAKVKKMSKSVIGYIIQAHTATMKGLYLSV